MIINPFDFLDTHIRTDQEDPLKVFRFLVEISGGNGLKFQRLGFTEVSAPKHKTEMAEFREGGMNTTPQLSPGITKFDPITCKRGQLVGASTPGDMDALIWAAQIFKVDAPPLLNGGDGKSLGPLIDFRRTVTIIQHNKAGIETRRWELVEAWITEFKPFSDLSGLSSDNSVEEMTICYEGYRQILLTEH